MGLLEKLQNHGSALTPYDGNNPSVSNGLAKPPYLRVTSKGRQLDEERSLLDPSGEPVPYLTVKPT